MGLELEAYVAKLIKLLRSVIDYLASSVTYFSIAGLAAGVDLILMAIPTAVAYIAIPVVTAIAIAVAIVVTKRILRIGMVGSVGEGRKRRLATSFAPVAAMLLATFLAGFVLVQIGLSEVAPTTWFVGVGAYLVCAWCVTRGRFKSLLIVGSSIIAVYPLIALVSIEWGLERGLVIELGVLLILYVFGGFYDLREAMKRLLEERELERRGAEES